MRLSNPDPKNYHPPLCSKQRKLRWGASFFLAFKDSLIAEQERLVLWLPVLMGAGIGFYFLLPAEPPLWAGPAGMLAAGGLGLLGRRKASLSMVAAAAIAGAPAFGFTVIQWRAALVAAPVLERPLGPTGVSGRVAALETLPSALRVTLEKPAIGGLLPNRTPEKVRVSLRGPQPDMAPGDWLWVLAKLTPPPAPAVPGGYDFQRQSFFRGLGAVGFGFGMAKVTKKASDSGVESLLNWLANARHQITVRIMEGLPGTKGAIAAALMTGERKAVPKDLMESIRASGLAHLLAISGLHIGLVTGLLFVGLRAALALIPPIALCYPIKKWAALAAIAGAFCYTLLAGATVPTQRAFLMIGLVLLGVLFNRRGVSMRLVAWAAAAVLLIQPESLLGASFQLSFAAVIALVAAYETTVLRRKKKQTGSRWRILAYPGGVVLTSLIAGIATTPFAIFHFNRFAVYGLAANLVAVPVTALWIMPWAVVAFLLMPFGLEGLALVPMGWGISVVSWVAEVVASWPGAVALLPAMPLWGLALVTLGGLWLCLWRRRWRIWGAAAIVAGLATLTLTEAPDVLVDGRGRLIAVKTNKGGLAVSSMRRARFDRQVWLRRAGLGQAQAWPTAGDSLGGRLSCDPLGCLYRASGHLVALVKEPAALLDDCRSASVVVSLIPIRRHCASAGTVVDRFDLWRSGAHALWLEKGGRVRIESVNGHRKNRPWVVQPGRQRK